MAGTLPVGTLAEAHKFDCEKKEVCCTDYLVQERGCLREGSFFTDIEDMAIISHKMTPKCLFFAIDAFLPFFLSFWDWEKPND